MSELHYDVLVNDGLRRHRDQVLPDGSPIISSPVASTLIYGDRDAVLVDPPFTFEQKSRVGDWIELRQAADRRVRHPRPRGSLVRHLRAAERFPAAVGYATNGTLAIMHEQATSAARGSGTPIPRPDPSHPR